ncbi:MAG: 50S ribosomal protein L24 [Christensenellales bacterium]|jgi:large subunit ribosomal protein L24
MNKLNVKKGDTVVVISGKDKGKKGKVLSAMPKTGRVSVEGVAMITRHTKPVGTRPGGRIKKEGTIDASNVMLVCGKCNKATRVAHKITDGKKTRACKKCGASID